MLSWPITTVETGIHLGGATLNPATDSLVQAILDRWRGRANDVLLKFEDDQGLRELTGADLIRLAGTYAAGLAKRGVRAGDRVGLVLTTGEPFVGALFGAWWLGAAAVPLAPPSPRQNSLHEGERLLKALRVAGARLAVVPELLKARVPFSPVPLVTPKDLEQLAPLPGPVAPLDLAVVQFSSGSTGDPKGVALHDRHLLANIQAVNDVLEGTEADRGVSWLPLYHDMGLIGSLLYTQYVGIPTRLMPPEHFIRMPARWFKAISEERATLSVAPNFAYQLCLALSDAMLEGVDLSTWRVAMIGAEPIRPAAVRRFNERFAPYGYRATTLLPTYGLAEATVAVAMTPPGQGLKTDAIDRRAFEEEHVARPDPDNAGMEHVSVGPILPGVQVAIRDEEGRELGERQVGEIWVRSPALMAGYYQNPAATAQVMQEGWLRTGDLGYVADGHLYIAGRIKDLIIRGGAKYHPQDLEAIAEAHPLVRLGGTAAFMVPGDDARPERVVLLVEPKKGERPSIELDRELRAQIVEAIGLRVDELAFVEIYQLPKTTSGKIRRTEARKRYLAGAFGRVHA